MGGGVALAGVAVDAGMGPGIVFAPAGSTARRRAAEQFGRRAEQDVAAILRRDGYEILAERLRTGAGEIDLVAARGDRLVFVEVKARRSFRQAAEALGGRQQARLFHAAEVALAKNPHWMRENIRFDVALVACGHVELIEDAIRLQ